MRTNCIDCLDRTNVVQSQIALRVLEDQVCTFVPTMTLSLTACARIDESNPYPVPLGFHSSDPGTGSCIQIRVGRQRGRHQRSRACRVLVHLQPVSLEDNLRHSTLARVH